MTTVHLNWQRDSEGCRLVSERDPETDGPALDPDAETRWHQTAHIYIARSSSRLRECEPLTCDGLWKQLADCRTPNKALAFVSRWGLLQKSTARKEALAVSLARAEWLRNISEKAGAGAWDEVNRGVNWHADGPIGAIGRMGVVLVPRETGAPDLGFRPHNLDAAICIQALMDLTGGTHLRKCANPACPEWFKYGPGTRHRETARFCSDKCRYAKAYIKSKGATK